MGYVVDKLPLWGGFIRVDLLQFCFMPFIIVQTCGAAVAWTCHHQGCYHVIHASCKTWLHFWIRQKCCSLMCVFTSYTIRNSTCNFVRKIGDERDTLSIYQKENIFSKLCRSNWSNMPNTFFGKSSGWRQEKKLYATELLTLCVHFTACKIWGSHGGNWVFRM
jgi:hypothetical protein